MAPLDLATILKASTERCSFMKLALFFGSKSSTSVLENWMIDKFKLGSVPSDLMAQKDSVVLHCSGQPSTSELDCILQHHNGPVTFTRQSALVERKALSFFTCNGKSSKALLAENIRITDAFEDVRCVLRQVKRLGINLIYYLVPNRKTRALRSQV